LEVAPENTYYEIEYKTDEGEVVTLYPRAQVNPQMGLLASPDILKQWDGDLYTHVSSIQDPQEAKEWSEPQEHLLAIGDTFFLNDYVTKFEKVTRLNQLAEVELGPQDVAIEASIALITKEDTIHLSPKLVIKDGMLGRIADEQSELGIRIILTNVKPEQNKFEFSVRTAQKEWIILKALQKPHINLLWLGTILVLVGFGLSIWRRSERVETKETPVDASTPEA